MDTKNYRLEKWDNGRHFFLLEPDTAAHFMKDGNYRVICTISTESFHAAILPKKEGGHCISIGTELCKKLKLKAGDLISVAIDFDYSEYQFAMPVEFKEVLETDPVAKEVFHSLTEGNQRSLIYLVSKVKSTDKRIEKALKIAERIKNGNTSPK